MESTFCCLLISSLLTSFSCYFLIPVLGEKTKNQNPKTKLEFHYKTPQWGVQEEQMDMEGGNCQT